MGALRQLLGEVFIAIGNVLVQEQEVVPTNPTPPVPEPFKAYGSSEEFPEVLHGDNARWAAEQSWLSKTDPGAVDPDYYRYCEVMGVRP